MKKRFSRFTGLFLAVGLSMSMITACGSDSSDDKKEDKKEKEEKTLTADEAAEEFASSEEVTEIGIDGTSVKIIADVSGNAAGQEIDIDANVVVDVRLDPQVMRATVNAEYQGEKTDIEAYVFAGDDGKYYLEIKQEDGSYQKSEAPAEYASTIGEYFTKMDTPLFTEDTIKQVAQKLKETEALGKKTVDGKEYDAFEIKLSEEKINEAISTYLPAIAAQFGSQYGIDQTTIDAYTQQLPTGYKEVPVDFYFDNGLPAGISIDLSNVLAVLSGDESGADANCVLTVLLSYNDKSEIAIPEAETVDTPQILD